MSVKKKPKLVVAVSGGVDSTVMLDKLAYEDEFELVVAHVNHGIRDDADDDEAFVRLLAETHSLMFESTKLCLGPDASEQLARFKRHIFLENTRVKHGAIAIATAHHKDDVVETIILNIIRGTGWRGLASLRQTEKLRRPLIDLRKSQITEYAISRSLNWHEDSTNDDLRYLRNLIRNFYLPRLTSGQFDQLAEFGRRQVELRPQIEQLTAPLQNGDLQRGWLDCDDAVAVELLRGWLSRSYQSATYRRLLEFGRSALPGKKFNLPGDEMIMAKRSKLIDMTEEKR